MTNGLQAKTDVLTTGIATAVCWLLFVGLWSGPSLGATLPYPNGLLPTELALVILLLVLWRRQGVPLAVRSYPFLHPCLAALGVAAIAAGLRVLWRGAPFDALRLWQDGEPMLRGLLIYLALVHRPRLARPAVTAMLAGLAVLALATIVQHFTGITRWYTDLDGGWTSGIQAVPGERPQGLTSYINLTAAMLASALPYWLLPLAVRAPLPRWQQTMLAAGGIAAGAALLYTNSRGPMLAAAAVLGVTLVLLSPSRVTGMLLAAGVFVLAIWFGVPAWALGLLAVGLAAGSALRRHVARPLAPIAVAVALAGLLQLLDIAVLHRQLDWRLAEKGLVDHARGALYRETLQVVEMAPWCGIGDRAFSARVPFMDFPKLLDLPATQWNAHCQYLQWAAAEGIPVAVVFTIALWWAVSYGWRQGLRQTLPTRRTLTLATAAATTIFLLCNLVDAHFWRIEGGGFFWSLLTVGMVCARVRPPTYGTTPGR